MKYISKRLERLEQKAKPEHSEIIKRIRMGVFYDELTDDERDAYCGYLDVEREVFERVNLCVLESLHFELEMKRKPLTKNQFYESVKEIEAYAKEMVEAYNTPEAKAKRETEYMAVQRIGRLRKKAFERGGSMDKYPLPWNAREGE